MRRSVLTTVLVCLLTGAGLSTVTTAGAEPAAPTVQAKPRSSVTVLIKTPAGVPASVRLVGPVKRTITKKDAGKRRAASVKLPVGRYRVVVDESVSEGRDYVGRSSREWLTVKAGQKSTLKVRLLRRARPVDVQATQVKASSVTLGWRAPKGNQLVLRRSSGSTAPRTVRSGSPVDLAKSRAVDKKVEPGRTYSYSLFARGRGGWSEPASVTVGTPDPVQGDPSFVPLPSTSLASARDTRRLSVEDGALWLAVGRTPAIGSGFVFPDSGLTPGGYVAQVAEIAANGRSVRLVEAGLGDVFDSYDIDVDLATIPDASFRPIRDPRAAEAAVARASRTSGEPASQPCVSVSATTDVVGVTPVMSTTGHVRARLDSRFHVPVAAEVDASLSFTAGVTVDMQTSAAITCSVPGRKIVKQLTAYPVPLVLVFEPIMEVSGTMATSVDSLTTTVTAGAWTQARWGAGPYFRAGPILRLDQTATSQFTRFGPITASFGGALTVGPGAGTPDVGVVAGIGGYLKPLVLELTNAHAARPYPDMSCLDAQLKFQAGLDLTAKAWAGPLSLSAAVPLLKGDFPIGSPVQLPAGCLERDSDQDGSTYSVDCDDLDAAVHPGAYDRPGDGIDQDCQNGDAPLGGGRVQATLRWSSGADLDLHAEDPWGEEIYYGHQTSDSGGALDVDANAGCGERMASPVENIYWPATTAPTGTYWFWVETYRDCEETDLSWHLTVKVDGVTVVDETGYDYSDYYEVSVGTAPRDVLVRDVPRDADADLVPRTGRRPATAPKATVGGGTSRGAVG